MTKRIALCWALIGAFLHSGVGLAAQEGAGSIRGVVYDQDFEIPLPAAKVLAVEAGLETRSGDQGQYRLAEVPPGTYTLIFSKEGYVDFVKAGVVVQEGRLTDVDAWLEGDFTEMEEFVVEDILSVDGGSETALLQLRLESPALMDSVGSDLMSRAGASDAASALKLVSGASLQEGKFAVIRGLPDRYVSSQMNGVRLPSADEDKRAVELDQFPAQILDSIQVTKTFTPDQQGDASGGAVDVRLKGIPEESLLSIGLQYGRNSQVAGRDDFLSYHGGGPGRWGLDDGRRAQQLDKLGENWDGAVGVTRGKAPIDFKLNLATGGELELSKDWTLGGFANLFYERDSSYFDNGINDHWWVDTPGEGLTPEYKQGTPTDGDFKTSLFDVTQGTQSVQWGGLGTIGLEHENHQIGLTYMYSQSTEDKATLAEDTRGKEYYFPGYDPGDPTGDGNLPDDLNSAPYIRTETLEYTERTATTLQLAGRHRLSTDDVDIDDTYTFRAPELDWTISGSSALMNQPDKRMFGSLWLPRSYNEGVPPWIPPFFTEETWYPFKPAANFTLGNLQRIWKRIDEESDQYALNLKLPFGPKLMEGETSDRDGYLKFGLFDDRVKRHFTEETFSNFGDSGISFEGSWDDFWSDVFPDEDHPIEEALVDVDYDGDQHISAWYGMIDFPISESVNVVGGARVESTEIGIVNHPEEEAVWFPPGATAPVQLNPGDADVEFAQEDLLPSVGASVEVTEDVTLRAAYGETVARQTFKELTPILQQEFLGAPIFIGNPELQMAALRNYDLRLDFQPNPSSLVSLSWFYKEVEDPIEYVQRLATFTFTTPVNYPKGRLSGWEFELRQGLGDLWEPATGLSVGLNATIINSKVTLTDEEIAEFDSPGIQAPMNSRDMTNAPHHLYNLYTMYDLESTGTQLSLFYTVQGDTLVAGAGVSDGNFVPNVYAKEFGTLNFGLVQRLGEHFRLVFRAKNLTNPAVQTVYRSEYIPEEKTRTSFSAGIDYSIALGANFKF